MDINEEYRQKQRLVANIHPWWKKNGWSDKTLNSKTVNQLLGIQTRMLDKKQAVTVGVAKSGQARMYFK